MKLIVWKKLFQLRQEGFRHLIEKGWRTVETYSYLQNVPGSLQENPAFIVDRVLYDSEDEFQMGFMEPMGKLAFFRSHYAEKDKEMWKRLMANSDLIALLEARGSEIVHSASQMKVVEIPEGIDWDICELAPRGEIAVFEKSRLWK